MAVGDQRGDKPVSVVKINAITVPAERADEMARRFAARAGEVGSSDGFEEFQLLRPSDDRTTWLVYTRWRDEAAFAAWTESRAFQHAHAGERGGPGGSPSAHGGPPSGDGVPSADQSRPAPVASSAELWSFGVEQRELAP